MDKGKKKDITIAIIFVMLICSLFANVLLLQEVSRTKMAFDYLMLTIIQVSPCGMLKAMHTENALMDSYGDYITSAEKDKKCQ